MKKNMGTSDRIIRLILAIITTGIISCLYIFRVVNGASAIAIALLVLSGVFAITSFISYCPLYTPFGINTSKKKQAAHP